MTSEGIKKIGVLSEFNPSAYSRQLGRCLEDEAGRQGLELSILGVDWANSEHVDERALDQSLSWASDHDAVVLFSGVFSHGVSGLSRFSQRWSPRPVVSVGYRLPGVPSLLIDNRGAMRSATSHLIEKHNRKNLLFIRGRKDSQESEARYLGFRHALRDHGLLFDERRLLTGDFTRRGAIRALSHLDADVEFDGILTANDDMALAALMDLRRRNLRVPEDVALIGFDDIPQAAQAVVPLTSLAQPFEEMACLAIESILQQSAGRGAEPTKSVTIELVTRASCGCS